MADRIGTPDDIKLVRSVGQNVDLVFKAGQYIGDIEDFKIASAITVGLYRQLISLDRSQDPVALVNNLGDTIVLNKAAVDIIYDGGYWNADDALNSCPCDGDSICFGLHRTIGYFLYDQVLSDSSVQIAAFDNVFKNIQQSAKIDTETQVRQASDASKKGYAALASVQKYLKALGLIECCRASRRPEKFKNLNVPNKDIFLRRHNEDFYFDNTNPL